MAQSPYTLTFGIVAVAPIELVWPKTRILRKKTLIKLWKKIQKLLKKQEKDGAPKDFVRMSVD